MFLALLGREMLTRLAVATLALATLTACSGNTPVSPAISSATSVTVANGNDGTTLVTGRVYGDSGTGDLPLSNAEVVVVSGTSTVSTLSGDKGYYSLTVTPGSGTITASKRGYTSKSWSIDVASNLVVNFSLASE
jgi:hypothetical protein